MKTVVGTFDNIQNAYAAANDLVSAGYNRNDISVVATNTNNQYSPYVDTKVVNTTDDVGTGAGIGAAIGGIGGLLVGLGALAIPGIGPVIAAGPLLAALTGAGVGAVAGGIVGHTSPGQTQKTIKKPTYQTYKLRRRTKKNDK
jgi:predicted phage tail protein